MGAFLFPSLFLTDKLLFMKRLLLSTLLFSSLSSACPHLAGSFDSCSSTHPEYPLEAIEIGQFGSHFTMTAHSQHGAVSDEVFADGQKQLKVVNAEGFNLNVEVKAECTSSMLTIETRFKELFFTEVTQMSLAGDKLVIENYRWGKSRNRTTCHLVH